MDQKGAQGMFREDGSVLCPSMTVVSRRMHRRSHPTVPSKWIRCIEQKLHLDEFHLKNPNVCIEVLPFPIRSSFCGLYGGGNTQFEDPLPPDSEDLSANPCSASHQL